MARLITLLIIGFGAYWFFRQLAEKLKNKAKPTEITQKKMVQCSYCGVHVPQDKNFTHNQKNFCSQEHLALFSKEQNADSETDETHDDSHE